MLSTTRTNGGIWPKKKMRLRWQKTRCAHVRGKGEKEEEEEKHEMQKKKKKKQRGEK